MVLCVHYHHLVQVLSHLLGGRHHVPLCDPVLQVLHLSAQEEVLVGVVQLLPAVLGQFLQTSVLFVHLSLSPDDALPVHKVKEEQQRSMR